MKKIFKYTLIIAGCLLGLSSCKGTWLMYDVDQKDHLLFKDTKNIRTFSFALLPNDQGQEMEAIVYLMGVPSEEDRSFVLESVPAKDDEKLSLGTIEYPVFSAKEGVDFELSPLILPAGATKVSISIKLKRNPEMLEGKYAKIHLRLKETEEFKAIEYNDYSSSDITSPEYILYVTDGEPACPDWWTQAMYSRPLGWHYNLGDFFPEKYRKLLAYFHETEKTSPTFYHAMVDKFGRNLDEPNIEKYGDPEKEDKDNIKRLMNNFWRTNYPNAWAKFVFVPLYEYYLEYYETHKDDPNVTVELMGTENVNQNAMIGWADPVDGRYGMIN